MQLRAEASRLTVQQLADMLLQDVLQDAPPPTQQMLDAAEGGSASEQGSWAVVQQQEAAQQHVAREAMYQLVKQQRPRSQALLLTWLMQSNANSSSTPGKQVAAASAMLHAEVRLLSARLAVKQQAWCSARQAALAAESVLAQLVSARSM